jgi:lipid-A-disaccharide synthase
MLITDIRQNNRQKPIGSPAQNGTFYRVCLYILRGGKKSPKIGLPPTGKNRGKIPCPGALQQHRRVSVGEVETPPTFLVSAGEASGDMYAAGLVAPLRELLPNAKFYGCAGPKLQAQGVQPVIDAASLSVVGLAEVVAHLPRIYGQYRKLLRYARAHPPTAAILTDNPDFHLRLARHLKKMGVPVFYLVAPQVWAWRQGRVKTIRRLVDKLFCLFPFEEPWFRERGVDATYIGHPLASMARTSTSAAAFRTAHGLAKEGLLVTLLPGSRPGEALRHMPVLLGAVALLHQRCPQAQFILATPKGFAENRVFAKFRERIASLSIKLIENEAWDCIGHASLALAASGTVTMEAAVLGTPMVTFYKVTAISWWAGRRLVKVPYLSMVNLVAGRLVVPELIQDDMTAEKVAGAANELLSSESKLARMRTDLNAVRASLNLGAAAGDPLRLAAHTIAASLGKYEGVRETMN